MSNFPPFLLQKKEKNPNESFLVTDDVSVIFFFFVHNSMLIVGVFFLFCFVEKKRDFTEGKIWSFFIQFERVLIHSFKSNQSGIIVIAREKLQTSFDDAILI